MPAGQMLVDQMSVGQMSVSKMFFTQKSVTKFLWPNVCQPNGFLP
jgi:hypothetical protein